jgi:hypothetical protein
MLLDGGGAMIPLQFIRDECRCEDVRDKCAVCGKSCKLIDLVWDKHRNKVVCYDCDTETQAANAGTQP